MWRRTRETFFFKYPYPELCQHSWKLALNSGSYWLRVGSLDLEKKSHFFKPKPVQEIRSESAPTHRCLSTESVGVGMGARLNPGAH